MNLQITVVDYDRMSSSDPIGRVVLGDNATGPQLKHWAEMIANPRRPIAQWHKLLDPDDANVVMGKDPKGGKGKGGKGGKEGRDDKAKEKKKADREVEAKPQWGDGRDQKRVIYRYNQFE